MQGPQHSTAYQCDCTESPHASFSCTSELLEVVWHFSMQRKESRQYALQLSHLEVAAWQHLPAAS